MPGLREVRISSVKILTSTFTARRQQAADAKELGCLTNYLLQSLFLSLAEKKKTDHHCPLCAGAC